MNGLAITMLAALAGLGDGPSKVPPPRPAVAAAAVGQAAVPKAIEFEIREITLTSPDWRGKLMARMTPVGRQEATAAWTLDQAGYRAWLAEIISETHTNVLQGPKMLVRIGEPARMTNEEVRHYVGSLKHVADGNPGAATQLAFQPQVEEAHDGIRVNILSSQVRDGKVDGQFLVEENRILGFFTTKYRESIVPKPGEDPGVVRTSFVDRIMPKNGPQTTPIAGLIEIPDVDSRRIEGHWTIPADGALVVSMGPRPSHDKALRKGYAERVVAIIARPTTEEPQAPSSFPDGARSRVKTVIPGKASRVQPAPRQPRSPRNRNKRHVRAVRGRRSFLKLRSSPPLARS